MVYVLFFVVLNSLINNRKLILNFVGNYDVRNYDFFIMFVIYLFVVKYYGNVKL